MIKVIGSALIKNTEGKYLALKLKKEIVGNNYVPPGGKLEENETLRDCVIREVKEELNIDIDVKGIKGITEEKYDDGTWTFVLFDCVIIFGEPQITELDKISEIKWVELSEIKNSNSILWIDNNFR